MLAFVASAFVPQTRLNEQVKEGAISIQRGVVEAPTKRALVRSAHETIALITRSAVADAFLIPDCSPSMKASVK